MFYIYKISLTRLTSILPATTWPTRLALAYYEKKINNNGQNGQMDLTDGRSNVKIFMLTTNNVAPSKGKNIMSAKSVAWYVSVIEELDAVLLEWAYAGWADQVEAEWLTVRSGELSRAGQEEFYMGTRIRRSDVGEV